jgi:hypothetical protein
MRKHAIKAVELAKAAPFMPYIGINMISNGIKDITATIVPAGWHHGYPLPALLAAITSRHIANKNLLKVT